MPQSRRPDPCRALGNVSEKARQLTAAGLGSRAIESAVLGREINECWRMIRTRTQEWSTPLRDPQAMQSGADAPRRAEVGPAASGRRIDAQRGLGSLHDRAREINFGKKLI